MSVKINSFGGPVTWLFRKHCSNLTSKLALSFAALRYKRGIKKYIRYFESQKDIPVFTNLMIETINRCNGSCAFCPASKDSETRPFKRMNEKMYRSIIEELRNQGWKGKLFLSIYNEPFVDVRILKFAEYAKDTIPGVFVELVTNGTLLSPKKMYDLVGKIDRVTINDYSSQYALSKLHRSIYREIKTHKEAFRNIEVILNRRYSQEILATRAGHAPNKKAKNNNVNGPCIYPFMDFLIFPDGKVGMCCNDCNETSDFGDVNKNSLMEIWNNEKYSMLRKAMKTGDRRNYPFCKECDVVDAGGRERQIKEFFTKKR
jgi:radical SAM protein with 4Fe4S-binding SPASM domain